MVRYNKHLHPQSLFFFEEVIAADLQTCMVTNTRYLEILTNYVISNLQQRNSLSDVVVCMKDGALSHLSHIFCQSFLTQQFGDRVISAISRFRDCQGPPISLHWISGFGDT